MEIKEPESNKNFSFQCIDAIEVSLCIEKQGLLFYEKAAKLAREPKVRDIFSRLAKEEKEHIQSLQDKAQFLQPALVKKSVSRKEVDRYIAQELKGKVFPRLEETPEIAPETMDDQKALDFGIDSERRSIEVLKDLLERERKIDVRVVFSHLLAEERKHLSALQDLKESLYGSGD